MWKRWLLITAVLLVVAFLGLYVYLGSSSIAGQVRDKLKQLLGVDVAVGSARIGILGGSTAQGVVVQERDPEGSAAPPLLTIHEAALDLTLLGVLASGTPSSVELVGADLNLRFGADGKLLSGLPNFQGEGGPVPRVKIRDGTIVLHQLGRDPLRLTGATLDVSTGADGYSVAGTVADPNWGPAPWQIEGSYQPAASLFTLRLTTPRAELDMARLRQLPFVSPAVWKAVEVAGTTGVDFTLRVPLGQKANYKVALDIVRADVHVPAIELRATDVSGKAVVQDSLVTLGGLAGKFAGGKLATTGELDFRTPPSRMTFDLDASDVVLSNLPKTWKIPPPLRGEVTMKADLAVTLAPEGVRTSGQGEGRINRAMIEKVALPSIPLRLDADGRRFKFTPKIPLFLPGLALVEPAAEEPRTSPAGEWLQWGAQALAGGTARAIDTAWNGTTWLLRPRRPTEAVSYLEAEPSADGLDIGELVRQMGFTLPVPVEGWVSFRMRLGIPLIGDATLRDYRLAGRVAVVGLRVGELRLPAGAATLRFNRGVLTLDTVAGVTALPIPGEAPPKASPLAVAGPAYLLALPAARLDGTARAEVAPLGQVAASLTAANVPLDRFLGGLTEGAVQPRGRLDGRVDVRVPLARAGELKAWTADARVAVPALDIAGVALRDLAITPSLVGGVLTVPTLTGTVQGAAVTGTGSLDLSPPFRVTARARLTRADLEAFPVAGLGQGTLDLGVRVGGTLLGGPTLAGRVSGDRLVLVGFPLDRPAADWTWLGSQVRIDRLTAGFFGGTLAGSGTLPLTARQTGHIDVRGESISLAALVASIPGLPLRVGGPVGGTLRFDLGEMAGGVRPMDLDVNLTGPRLALQDLTIQNATTRLRHDGRVARLEMRGEALGGVGRFEGTFRTAAGPPEWEATAELKRVRLDRLDADLGGNSGFQALRGTIDLDFKASQAGDAAASGTGRALATGLGWQGQDISEDVRLPLVLDGSILRIRDVDARIAGGALRLSLGINFRNFDRSWFVLDLSGAELGRLLGPLLEAGPSGGLVRGLRVDASDRVVEGPIDLTLRGRIGREWSASGAVVLTRGKLAAVEVEELRLPLVLAWSPLDGSGTVTVAESVGRLGRGQARGGLRLHWTDNARAFQIAGSYRFFEIELRSLSRTFAGMPYLGHGRVAGTVEFGGTSVRTLEDLSATLDARLTRTQALQMPVLRGLTPFLQTVRGDLAFGDGRLLARLQRGIVRVEHLYLNSELLRLALYGSLTVGGRLDLDAVALTGPELLQAPSGPGRAPVPLAEALRLITSRALHFRITGSIDSPHYRLEPLQSLADELARFLGYGIVPR